MKINHRDILENGKKLPLVEDFYTIQGEGYYAGKAAYFIRVGGCDVGCSWCDSKNTWNPDIFPPYPVDEIVKKALLYAAKAVVVTGGEPLMYNLKYLCAELKKNGIETFIETSGAHELSGEWDWICLSPKKLTPPVKEIFQYANELKVIIYSISDFKWAERNAAKVGKTCKLYLQPEWSSYEAIIPEIVEYVKENPKWNISLQVHKFMHIP